ncbi:MAG: hypothetical protein IKM48_05920 [Clostridia bacterium]|nr:hypothetical protein [Clostridia bacterium]
MDPKEYIVAKIEGEYATLQNIEDGGEIFIAMALLPDGVNLGSRLRYELFTYTLIE